ncbi:hypothetical protein Q5752_002118 [Cryptotrichosporon argae]
MYIAANAAPSRRTRPRSSLRAQSPPTTVAVASGTDAAAYATNYLTAHMMSAPSYRYAYLLWCVLGAFALAYTLAHALRLSGGSLGAAYNRWGMRRYTLGTQKRGRPLPSNSVLVALAALVAAVAVLCLVGPDYISPSDGVFALKRALTGSPPPPFLATWSARTLGPRATPSYTINKAWWTSGSRFGFIAFALVPLVVLLALKASPAALLAFKWTAALAADKLQVFHRAAAWLLWAVTTVHVAFWTVQLFEDTYQGAVMWTVIWRSYRFCFGIAAYLAMTGVMVLSLKPIRKHGYEFFYAAHVVLVFLTIVCSAIHHPVLWYWMAISLALWGIERATRAIRLARINGAFSSARTPASVIAGQPYETEAFTEAVPLAPVYADKTLPRTPAFVSGDREFSAAPEFGGAPDTLAYDDATYDSRYSLDATYSGTRNGRGYGYGGGGSGSRTPELYANGGSRTPDPYATARATPDPYAMSAGGSRPGTLVGIPPPPPVPVGYAQAQLLPSRTLRLTIRVARPFRWAPGQSVLLYLPELSRFQSHPFTITNAEQRGAGAELVLLVKARKGLTKQLFEMVRRRSIASSSFSDKHDSLSSAGGKVRVPPVHVKAWVDGPFGSAGRVRWTDYSTAVIVCGGSGVSFGAAICEHLCRAMQRGANTRRVRFCWVVREYVEIAWIASQLCRCRSWVGPEQLQIDIYVTSRAKRGADELAPPQPRYKRAGRRDSYDSLVSADSSAETETEPEYAFGRGEADAGVIGLGGLGLAAAEQPEWADVVDLTHYEDEEDVRDPAEDALSQQLQQQGKLRRARSRRRAKQQHERDDSGVTATLRAPKPLYPPTSRPGSALSPTYAPSPLPPYGSRAPSSPPSRSISHDALARLRGSPRHSMDVGSRLAYDALEPQGQDGASLVPYAPSRPSPHAHSHSHASSHAGPGPGFGPGASQYPGGSLQRDSSYSTFYDPFTNAGGLGPGPSPAPSIMLDDAQSVRHVLSRSSRTQSMILLDPAGTSSEAYTAHSGGGAPGAQQGDAGSAMWIDEADYTAMGILSEMARTGRPKLAALLDDEITMAAGSMIVTTCGPVKLNTVVRNLVSRKISPGKIRRGDARGNITVYSEDYES